MNKITFIHATTGETRIEFDLPARANRSVASEHSVPSETPHVLRWPLMSLEHSEILTPKSPLGSTKLAPQSPPTYRYLENSHEAILASGALQATQYLKTEY